MTTHTSLAAYEDIKPKAPSLRDQVIDIVARNNVKGISRTQIAKELGINEITAGSRLTELLQAGKVARTGATTLSTSGKAEHLYVPGNGVPLPPKAKLVAEKVDNINPQRMADLLRRFNVTDDAVINMGRWSNEAEGVSFWIEVSKKLAK